MLTNIMKLERRNNSVNGNPKYEVYYTDDNGELQHATTASDYAFCYGITNDIYSLDKPQVWANITLSKSGKITSFDVVTKLWEVSRD